MKTSPILRKKDDKQTTNLTDKNQGKTLSPPPFQLQAYSNAPIQRKKLKLPNGNLINTKQMTEFEIRDLIVKLKFEGEDNLVLELQTALDNQDYDTSGGVEIVTEFWNSYLNDEEISDESEDNSNDLEDMDYSEFVGETSGMRLMEGGIKYAEELHAKREDKKPMPLNKVKGEMFELAFDQLREEEKNSNISTNSFVSNCPGIDHISPFGDRMFEQSKNHTSGSKKDMVEAYSNDFDRSKEMGSLLFNKGSKKGKIGSGINNLMSSLSSLDGLDKDQIDFGKKMNDSLTSNIKNDDEGDFDSEHEDVKEFQNQFYMQIPNDLWGEMANKYKGEVDGFFSQEINSGQMKEFEKYVVGKGYAITPKEIKKRKKASKDDEFVPEENKTRKKRKTKL